MKKLLALIPLIWILIHLIPIKDSEITEEILNNQEIVPLEVNGDVYLKGFNVPENQDPKEFGLQLYDHYKDFKPELSEELISSTKELFDTPNVYEFQGNYQGLSCLYNNKNNAYCQSKEELQQRITQNKILLSRLEKLWDYEHFDTDLLFPTNHYFQGQSFILLQQLFCSQLVLTKTNGESDEAIDLWLKNHKTLNAIMAGRNTMVEKAMIMIALQSSQTAILELTRNVNLTENQMVSIENELGKRPFGPEGFDLKKTAQAEYNYVFNTFHTSYKNAPLSKKIKYVLLVPGYTKNKFSKFYDDFIHIGTLPLEQYLTAYRKLQKEYDEKYDIEGLNFYKQVAYAPIESLLLSGLFKASGLYLNRFYATIKDRMIILAIRADQGDISPEDMPAYLNNQPKEFQNPITQKPFEWDGKNIFFIRDDMDTPETVQYF